jgi:hypothetical protein
MTTPKRIRCKHCAYLVEDEHGRWCCDAYDYSLVNGKWTAKDIEEIDDEDCPAEQEY